jgi:hypothetical protein
VAKTNVSWLKIRRILWSDHSTAKMSWLILNIFIASRLVSQSTIYSILVGNNFLNKLIKFRLIFVFFAKLLFRFKNKIGSLRLLYIKIILLQNLSNEVNLFFVFEMKIFAYHILSLRYFLFLLQVLRYILLVTLNSLRLAQLGIRFLSF